MRLSDPMRVFRKLSENRRAYGQGLALVLIFAICALVLLSQPPSRSLILFLVFAAAAAWTAALIQKLQRLGWRGLVQTLLTPEAPASPEESAQPLPRFWAAAELLLIVTAALWATRAFASLDESIKLPGGEAEWLTSSAHFAALNLREHGYIPLWQPWLEAGQPLVEDPFSFVLNPISAGPSLILGGVNGIKISVVLTAVLAGVGGWVLGRVLRLGSLGRTLLGLLMVGKGNMLAMLGTGYFQLGTSQAYFPWIAAGVLLVVGLPHRRWPVVFTAVLLTWLFWAGNIWYMLPMLIVTAVLVLFLVVRLDKQASPPGPLSTSWRRGKTGLVDWTALRRLKWTLLLTVGLSAVTLLPIWINRHHIGGHFPETDAGAVVDQTRVIEQYFNGDVSLYNRHVTPGDIEFYYSFISPVWFVLAIFLWFPLGWSFRRTDHLRLWIAGVLLILFFTVWGSGGNPVLVWLYRHLPLLDQWRFVGRALAVASFWIGVLIALRVDMLWKAARRRISTFQPLARPARWLPHLALAGLIAASGAAAAEVIAEWHVFARPASRANAGVQERVTNTCIAWLRAQHPDEELSVYAWGYTSVTPFLDHHVRLYNISADFHILPDASTLGAYDLTQTLPEYAVVWDKDFQEPWLLAQGYTAVDSSPEGRCLYRKANFFSYVFTIPRSWLAGGGTPTPLFATPVNTFTRLPDQITVTQQGAPEAVVLAVQERAYPGWKVTLDGHPARLESVGGFMGVVLPPDPVIRQHTVRFSYRPALLYEGGALTLVTALLCLLFLLRADQCVLRYVARRYPPGK